MKSSITQQITIEPKATRREWLGLAVLALPAWLVSMDMTVMYLALPVLSKELQPTSSQLLWMTDIYGFMEAGLLIVMGTVGDRIGRRRLLLYGGVAFAIASVIAAFSSSANMLIAARGLLGIAGATLLPSTLSLIRHMFRDDTQRTFAIGIWTTCFSAGTMLGPLIGGFLLSHFQWGSVFLMSVPLMILLLIAGPVLLPESRDKDKRPFDLASAGILIVSSLTVIYGIKKIASSDVTGWSFLFILIGLILGFLFLQRQKKLSHPLIDLSLFRRRTFSTALASLMVSLFSWAGIFLFVGQYLQLVLNMSPLQAGLWTIPAAGGSIVLCMLVPVILRRFRRTYLVSTALAIQACGIGLLAFVSTGDLFLLIIATVLISAGCGMTVTLCTDMVVAAAPPERAGAAAGISETSTTFGASLGVAILGSIWTIAYRNNMLKEMPPGISPDDAAAVTNTLGAALDVAQHSSSSISASLASHARDAFVHSLNITAIVCTVLITAMALAARWLLRHLR
jgi:DHA2 family multidrug resistance protein-like MFS transporter